MANNAKRCGSRTGRKPCSTLGCDTGAEQSLECIARGEDLKISLLRADSIEKPRNVRVDPIDIDKVHVGQDVVLRLPELKPRTTPELFAIIARVAPDATLDPSTGQHYYAARISIPDEELAQLPDGVQVVPGMPVEVYIYIYIYIEERMVLSYLTHPFVEQLRQAMQEE